MEFSLPTFTWVLSLKFEDVLFGGHQRRPVLLSRSLGIYMLVLGTCKPLCPWQPWGRTSSHQKFFVTLSLQL